MLSTPTLLETVCVTVGCHVMADVTSSALWQTHLGESNVSSVTFTQAIANTQLRGYTSGTSGGDATPSTTATLGAAEAIAATATAAASGRVGIVWS